jgi:hypothetical protein
MWGSLKCTYEALNWTTTNWITFNGTMRSQTKDCITKSIGYMSFFDITWRRVVITNIPPSIHKKSKRGIRTLVKLTNITYFFGGTLSIIWFFKKARFGSWLYFLFSSKETPNLVDPLDWVIINYWAPQSNLLWCVHENRPSPRVVTENG